MANPQPSASVVDLRPTVKPKSDQLNADDLIGRSLTITVTKVSLCGEPDQPIAVHFEGDDGKPYKPCKSMRRVMINVWGSDGNAFRGQSMTLYRDEKVAFGGVAVGGIRISHMTGLDREMTMALTATRAQRKPYTVKPLVLEGGRRPPSPPPSQTSNSDPRDQAGDFPGDQGRTEGGTTTGTAPLPLDKRADMLEERLKAAPTAVKLNAVWNANGGLRADLERGDPERLEVLTALHRDLDATLGEGAI